MGKKKHPCYRASMSWLWKLEHSSDMSCLPLKNKNKIGSQLKKPAKVPNFKIETDQIYLLFLWNLWFIIHTTLYNIPVLLVFVHGFYSPTRQIWDPYRATRRLMAMWLMILISVNFCRPCCWLILRRNTRDHETMKCICGNIDLYIDVTYEKNDYYLYICNNTI